MAQISRPFQIALVAVVLVAGVALFALKGGSSSKSGAGGSSAPVAAAKPSPPSSKPSSSTSDNLPQAPGVAGLERAIEKAHGAVATSQQNAHQLEQKSQEATDPDAGGAAAPPAPAASGSAPATAAPSTTTAPSPTKSARPSKRTRGASSKQRAVEAELAAGDVVIILFWDRKGADDVAVHTAVEHAAGFGVDVHVSTASQVAEYGTLTRGVGVYGTPTTLVVGPGGKTKVITGLTDEYSLRQAISEAITG